MAHTVSTHLGIDPRLCGTVTSVAGGRATVRLATTADMAADARGLVHGGFIFGLADYAAMVAVNDPHVVLGAAQTRFDKPVRRGDVIEARARVILRKGRKHAVEVTCWRGREAVMRGTFTCFVLDHHVLD